MIILLLVRMAQNGGQFARREKSMKTSPSQM